MFAKLDVSWRGCAVPIDILVNPKGPREVEALCAGQPWQSVRFQLNAKGVLWFADSNVSLHGDESRGVVVGSSVGAWFQASTQAPCLLYGFVALPAWKVEVHDNQLDLAGVNSASHLLHQFRAWRSAVQGVSYVLHGVSPAPKLPSVVAEVIAAARTARDYQGPGFVRLNAALARLDQELP